MIFDVKEMTSKMGNVFKNMRNDIIQECYRKSIDLRSEEIVVGILSFAIGFDEQISFEKKIDRKEIEQFIKKSVSKLKETNSPKIKSIIINTIFWHSKFDIKDIDLQSFCFGEKFLISTEILLKEITDFEHNSKDDCEKLFKKILLHIISGNRLGDSKNLKVITETSNALRSVMNREDIYEFVGMKRRAKLETLETVKKIVCGIMIFNKDAGDCGEEMRDIVTDVIMGYSNLKATLTSSLQSIDSTIEECKTLANRVYYVEANELYYHEIDSEIKSEISYFKEMVQLYNQHAYFVKYLLRALSKIRKTIDAYFDQFREILRKLHVIIQYRFAVPTEIVYPLFIELANIWNTLWAYLHLMVNFNKLNEKMMETTTILNHYGILENLEKIIKWERKLGTDYSGKIELQDPGECELIPPSVTKQFTEITPMQSFCAYHFIVGNGWLIQSFLQNGMLKYKNRFYSFSDFKYLKKFATNPSLYEMKFLRALEANPHLIVFFDLYEEVKEFHFLKSKDLDNEGTESKEPNSKTVEIQTEVHPIQYDKEPNYTWNIWDLRRRAIQLANARRCRTHSAQTNLSYHRNSTGLQTFELSSKPNQTKQDKAVLKKCITTVKCKKN